MILPQLLTLMLVLCIQCQIKKNKEIKSVFAKFIYANSQKRFTC